MATKKAKPKDDNDRMKDGTLNPDPFADSEPFGDEPKKAGKAEEAKPERNGKQIDLDTTAPTMAFLYGESDLDADFSRRLVSLAALPSWPGGPETGHGWGEDLDRLLGGGICPGYMLAVGAASAGAGKTAWIMQMADGLALRTSKLVEQATSEGEANDPLTPVLVLSEMSPAALTWRTLARWTSYDSRVFRAGASAAELLEWPQVKVTAAFDAAHNAFAGELGAARQFMRVLKAGSLQGRAFMDRAIEVMRFWKKQLEDAHRRPVWPVVVIDPIQRWQDQNKSEVEGLNEIVEVLGAAGHAEGWIVLMSSDTNKASATGDNSEKNDADRGRAIFRGSYKLQHLADAALFLERNGDPEGNYWLDVKVVKNRWGFSLPHSDACIQYKWWTRTGRFEPILKPKEGPPIPPFSRSEPKKQSKSRSRK